MKLPAPIPVGELAEMIGARLIGNADQLATGVNEIHKVEPGDITFVDVEKYFQKSLNSAATIIILNKETDCPPGKTLLLHPEPFEAYNNLVKKYRPFEPLRQTIGHGTIIHPSAIIEPHVTIGNNVTIGAYSYIQANAYIGDHTRIGKRVRIQAGAIIGTDAFYFKKKGDQYHKWQTGGRVLIEDDVEIGAGCTINRGVSGDTIVGAGSKLDCQVHLGHGVVLGKNCLIAGQTGIGGKTILGDRVVLYGQVGIIQNLHIGDDVVVLAGSGIMRDLEAGKTYFGAPATEVRQRYKELAALRQLPDFLRNHS
ncbi:MAG: UDP-3-O-(3-hydroxymyristoyl)glucosamine N-acyltransferase [Saprospiraceae bacterium]|nr:UDP-3-O-(3-hydroxymyristoyl)glucosamine N-acyltransferase [Saprospiraceae bacterium]